MVAYCNRLKVKPGWLISGDEESANTFDLKALQAYLYEQINHMVKPELHSSLKAILTHCCSSIASDKKTEDVA